MGSPECSSYFEIQNVLRRKHYESLQNIFVVAECAFITHRRFHSSCPFHDIANLGISGPDDNADAKGDGDAHAYGDADTYARRHDEYAKPDSHAGYE